MFTRAPRTRRFRHRLCALGLLFALAGAAAWALKPPGQAGDPTHPPRPGYLGVSLRDLDASEATRVEAAARLMGGALIVTVDRDAPAWAAGLRPGDVVLELNAQAVENVEDLRRRLRECPAGDTITVRILRRAEQRSFAVPLGDQDLVAQNAFREHLRPASNAAPSGSFGSFPGSFPSASFAPAPPLSAAPSRSVASTFFDALMPGAPHTGLECDTLSPQLANFFGVAEKTGLLVTGVNPGSPAADAGLTAGDVILRAANRSVNTRGALARALRAGKGGAVPLTVVRAHREVALSLQPGKRR